MPDHALATLPRPPVPAEEAGRLAALRRYAVLDTPAEPAFDRVAELAQALFDAPIALVSLVDAERQWFKARRGLAPAETPRDQAFCAYAILGAEVLVVPDATRDPRFAANPLVLGDPSIRFYAGAPIATPEGHRLGTVCVISPEPRPDGLTEADRARLAALAGVVASELELRLRLQQAEEMAAAQRTLAADREALLREVDHRVRNGLQMVYDMLSLQAAATADAALRQALGSAAGRVMTVAAVQAALQPSNAQSVTARFYLGRVLAHAGPEAAAAGRRITFLDGEDVPLSADDAARVGVVAWELVANALQHGRGQVDVALERQGGGLALTVTDQGEGPPEAALTRAATDPCCASGLALACMVAGGATPRRVPGGARIAVALRA